MIFDTLKHETEMAIDELLTLWDKGEFKVFYDSIYGQHKAYLNQSSQANMTEKDVVNWRGAFLGRIQRIVEAANIGRIFVSIHATQEALDKAKERSPLLAYGAAETRGRLDEIWNTLNGLAKRPQNQQLILQLMDQFEKINIEFRYYEYCKRFLDGTATALQSGMEKMDNEASLSIGFSAPIETLAQFNYKLNSLVVIYAEACLIFGINDRNHPLRIVKAESGSLWSKVFGESKVVEFIIWFLKNSVRYLHRNFTQEGKIKKIPQDIKTLQEEFSLHEKLQELLPGDRYKELIEKQAECLAKSAALLAKHTQNLIEREASVKINDEVISFSSASDSTKYLKVAAKQLPEHVEFIVKEPPQLTDGKPGEEKKEMESSS